MRYSTLPKKHKSDSRYNEYSFLYLENESEVSDYIAIDHIIKSKQSINLLFGFKRQTFHNDFSNYAIHEAESSNTLAKVLPLVINLSPEPCNNIFDYCNITDNLLKSLYESFYKWVRKGYVVRINHSCGACYVDSVENTVEITTQQMYNWMLNRSIENDMQITSKVISIENDVTLHESIVKLYSNSIGCKPEDIHQINNFKLRTILFEAKDYYSFFLKGIMQGLDTIVFQTTAQDIKQITDIKQLLESIMKQYPERILKVYIRCSEYLVQSNTENGLFSVNIPNIKINFIHK